MDDILIKTKSGGFKTVKAVASNPIQEDDLMKILQPKITAAPTKVVVAPSWRDKIATPVVAPKKEEIKIETVKPQPAPVVEIPSVKKVSAPAFYFDVKDEEEAKEFKDNNLVTEREKKEQSINLGAAKIARQIKDTAPEINIASPADLSRLSKIVASRLRDIRSLVETKDSLIKKTDSGGLAVAPEAVDKIIKIIEKEKTKWQEKPEEYIKSEAGSREPGMTFNQQPTTEKMPKWKKELEAGSDDINNPQLQKIAAAIKARDKNYELRSKDINNNTQPTIINRQQATDGRQITINNREDFNYQSYLMKEKRERRVIGPVEELLNMDLKEFRALGRSPKESVNKLYEKIVSLAGVSLEERAKGIAAWKSSPLYQLYVSVGEESLIKSLPIEGILKNNQNGLTWDEFQAISDLNGQLNY